MKYQVLLVCLGTLSFCVCAMQDSPAYILCKKYGLYGYKPDYLINDLSSDRINVSEIIQNKSFLTPKNNVKIGLQKINKPYKKTQAVEKIPKVVSIQPPTLTLYCVMNKTQLNHFASCQNYKNHFFYRYIPEDSFFISQLSENKKKRFIPGTIVARLTGLSAYYLIGKSFFLDTILGPHLKNNEFVGLSDRGMANFAYKILGDHDARIRHLLSVTIAKLMNIDCQILKTLQSGLSSEEMQKKEAKLKQRYRLLILREHSIGHYVYHAKPDDLGLKKQFLNQAVQKDSIPFRKKSLNCKWKD